MPRTRKKSDSASMEAWLAKQDRAVERVYGRRRKVTPVKEPLTIATVVANAESAIAAAHAFTDSVRRRYRVVPEEEEGTLLDALLEATRIVRGMYAETLAEAITGKLDTGMHNVQLLDRVAADGKVRKILIVDGRALEF